MNHLTDEQLSAFLDGALAAADRAACEAHVEACEACRVRLAETGSLDESLERSLEHDPGDAYFESFAERVAVRIAAEGARSRPQAAETLGALRRFWKWVSSPRGLALSGSTLALLLIAGLAVVRFQDRDRTAFELHQAAPSPVGSTLRERESKLDAQQHGEAAPLPAAVPPGQVVPEGASDAAPSPGFATSPAAPSLPSGARPEAARMQEVERNAAGDEVPARAPSPAAPPSQSGSASPLGQMKQRSIAPATGGTASKSAPAPQAATAPSPAPLSASDASPPARGRGTAPSEADARDQGLRAEESQAKRSADRAIVPCGTVRDSRGRAVSGAQVLVVNDVTRTARTGADGSFCLSRLEPGDQLSVLRVGYEPARITVTDGTSLALVMEPVGTLGPEAGKGLAVPGAPQAFKQEGTPSGASKSLANTPAKSAAPAPDVYSSQPAAVRDSVAAAREAARVARRDRAAVAMDGAAVRWDAVTALVAGAALHDARFQALSLRREALGLAPTAERANRFQADLRVYLAKAPTSLPEYATARRWQSEFDTRNKALYR